MCRKKAVFLALAVDSSCDLGEGTHTLPTRKCWYLLGRNFFHSANLSVLTLSYIVLSHFRWADSKTLKQPGFKFRQMYLSKYSRYFNLCRNTIGHFWVAFCLCYITLGLVLAPDLSYGNEFCKTINEQVKLISIRKVVHQNLFLNRG